MISNWLMIYQMRRESNQYDDDVNLSGNVQQLLGQLLLFFAIQLYCIMKLVLCYVHRQPLERIVKNPMLNQRKFE